MPPHSKPFYRPQEKRLRLNNLIRVPEVQVIDQTGKQLGVMITSEALKLSLQAELDLVEVGPTAKPPICKIMDYGKYQYEKEKKERQAKSGKTQSHGQEVKTVQIGFRTEAHDMGVRGGQVDKFLKKGYRVQVNLRLRGRERQMADIGRQKLESFLQYIAEPYGVDNPLKRSPNGWSILLKPEK
jgi:translation initiation factor IF-3